MIYLRRVVIVLFLLMAQLTFAARVRVMRDAMLNDPVKRELARGLKIDQARELQTNAARMAAGMSPLPPRSLYPTRVQDRRTPKPSKDAAERRAPKPSKVPDRRAPKPSKAPDRRAPKPSKAPDRRAPKPSKAPERRMPKPLARSA